MFGIRVFGLPGNATDKHLKVYFSNPKNGGGRVVNMYYPLPHDTAVVIFDDKRVVQDILKRQHTLLGQPIGISATPKQIFRRAVVELEKNVSDVLSINPQIVDELQFIGEVNVNFQYEKERYLLDGSWYKIEWALQYLDTALDACQPNMQWDTESGSRRPNTNGLSRERTPGRQVETQVGSPPRSHQIKRPNIPAVKQVKDDEQPKSLPLMTGLPSSNYSKLTGDHREENVSYQRQKKNKNAFPTGGASSKSSTAESKLYSKTMRSNLDYGYRIHADVGDLSDDEFLRKRGHSYNTFDRDEDSDSENEANLAAAYDRRVGFSSDTNFDEYNPRPRKAVPKMTSGIDVSHTDFGEVPLTFTFDLPGNLKVHVAMDDITRQSTDTIINPTTPDMSNVYGISRAILASAGYEMQMECQRYVKENGPMDYAGVTHTKAGGNLSQRVGLVLHTAGPNWREDESEFCTHMLVCTYLNCFQYADEKLWVQSLATPLISAGSFGFPLDVCIGAFYDALLIFSDKSTTKRHLKEIHLVCFDQDSAMATITIVQSLLDCERTESVAAATDRYWMRKSKHNFQAEDFSKPTGQETVDDKSDGEDYDTNDADISKAKDRLNKANKKSGDIEKSENFSDSDDESKKSGIASVKSDLDTSKSKSSEETKNDFGRMELKGSFTEKVKQKSIEALHDDSDNSLEYGLRDKDDDLKAGARTEVAKEKSDNISTLSSLDERSDIGKKYDDVDSDNESNTESGNRETFMMETEHVGKKNEDSDSKLAYKVPDDEIKDEDNDDDESKAFGDEEPDAKETSVTWTERTEKLKKSLTSSRNDVDAKADMSDDDGKVEKENEEELYL